METSKVQGHAASSPRAVLLWPPKKFSRLRQLTIRLKAPSWILHIDVPVFARGDAVSERTAVMVREPAI